MDRVLHLIDTGGPGGAETVLSNLAGEFRDLAWESRVIVPRRDWLFDRLANLGVETKVVPSNRSADIQFLKYLIREIHEFGPSLIHAHLLGSGVYGTLASSLAGGPPLVCTFHGIPDVNPSDPFLGIKSRILSRAQNRVVYVSHHLRRHLEPLLGIPAHLGRTIHNGVRFPDDHCEEGTQPHLDFEPVEYLVGAVGNIRPAKDYFNLLRAARYVCDRRSDTHFAIVGEGKGSLLDDLLKMRKDLNLLDRVHFLGFRKDITSLMRLFTVFVSSSSNEGLPLASVEAMGAGKPVVLTECGGVPELVDHGRTGLLVPVRDPEALGRSVLFLLQEEDVASRLGIEARESVKKNFSLQAMVQAYERLYCNLIQGSSLHHA